MFKTNSLTLFRRFLFSCEKKYTLSSLRSSSTKLYVTMKQLIDLQQYEKALDLFYQQSEFHTDVTINMALKACTKLSDYKRGMNIQEKLSSRSLNNPFIQTSLIHFYMQCHDVDNAHRLFSIINDKSNYIYGAMFKGYSSNKMPEKVLDLLDKMLIKPDQITLTLAFSACAQLADDRAKAIGKTLLEQMPNDFQDKNVILSSAIHMLMKFGDVKHAEHLYNLIKNKDSITHGLMINGYVENHIPEKALDLIEQMHLDLNSTVYIKIFSACAELADDRAKAIGKKLLEQMPNNFQNNNVILTSAIHMLMKFGDVKHAEQVFQLIKKKDIVSYNAMMNGYVENQLSEKTLDLFEQMHLDPVNTTYTIVFSACAELADDRAKAIGRKLLERMPNDFQENNIILNSAIHMLMKFGDVKHAEQVFQLIKKKDIVSYGAMMKGYNINDQPLNCFKLFEKMKQEGIVPNEIIFTLLIGACSQIGIVIKCENIVDQMPFNFYDDKHIRSSLVDMWGKVGAIKNAEKMFQSISTPDVISCTAMINSYGINGMGLEAIEIYRQIPSNLRSEVSHICVLNACSHAGLLDQARLIYNAIIMKTEKITAVMIDCLSRLFLFDEAEEIINNYEKLHSPCLIMYMAILSGARNARDSILSQKIYNRIKSLFPDQKENLIAASILLGNTYLSISEYEQAKDLRLDRRKQLGNKIKSGLSWTAPTGEVVYFRAHDRSNPRSSEIYAEIDRMSAELIKYGHNYDSSSITRPLEEGETIESVLCGHSEKLALAFNFIQSPVPSIIQIVKNLRACGDCHRATKLIAKIRQREIIVRDANRIHHFYPNGICSCQEHF